MLITSNSRRFDTIVHTVYQTTNLVNGKFYIGYHATKDLDDDYFGSGRYLLNSLWKYGWQNFKKETLFVYSTFEEAMEKEKELVAQHLFTNPLCMNLMPGGVLGGQTEGARLKRISTMTGRTHSEETKRKLSIANRGKSPSEETRAKISKGCLGKSHPQTEETRQKIRKTKAENPQRHSEETRFKCGIGNRGRIQSEEERSKRKESCLIACNTEESRKNRREGAKKRPPISEETRELMRKSAKLRCAKRKLARESSE